MTNAITTTIPTTTAISVPTPPRTSAGVRSLSPRAASPRRSSCATAGRSATTNGVRATGFPVLGFLGTPLSRLAHLGEAPDSAGVRLVLDDRSGYGTSDFHPGRTLLD